MKKKMMFAVVLFVVILGSLSTSTVYAANAWYTCTVVMVGGDYSTLALNLTDTAAIPAFSGKSFNIYAPDVTTGNRQMATALTAISTGKKLMVYVDPLNGAYPYIWTMYIIN